MVMEEEDQEVFLTSTTAPNKIFYCREELGQHYKSDWHKYNCKRKEAGLLLLNEEDFNARLQAALALKREQEGRHKKDGVGHLKNKDKKKRIINKEVQPEEKEEVVVEEQGEVVVEGNEPAPVIDPCQSLFDNTIHPTVAENVQYMKQTYGFFVPDAEYLVNLTSLIGYCQEKIQIGQLCLYCQRGFRSPRAVKDHMVDSRHTKIRYEEGFDLWEYEPFYDFSEANKEFWETWNQKKTKKTNDEKSSGDLEAHSDAMDEDEVVVNDEDDDSTEWQDVDNNDEDDDEDDDEEYEEYASNLAKQGFDVTPFGELIFPDGRIVGHRLLARFYKQRLARSNNNTVARRAVTMENRQPSSRMSATGRWAFANNVIARGQTGVLVSTTGRAATPGNFSTLSLYRYKAVVKQSRRDERRGKMLHQKHALNMNRMGKKANRLMNNVSVAHAKR